MRQEKTNKFLKKFNIRFSKHLKTFQVVTKLSIISQRKTKGSWLKLNVFNWWRVFKKKKFHTLNILFFRMGRKDIVKASFPKPKLDRRLGQSPLFNIFHYRVGNGGGYRRAHSRAKNLLIKNSIVNKLSE